MNNGNWYSGSGEKNESAEAIEFPASLSKQHTKPNGYLADQGLIDAANVALQLGQPLLLSGQPGTGKTQFAYSLAWELGFGDPLKFETKSTSTSRDLFYSYDMLGRFHAAQTGQGSANTLDYIRFNALGQAILRANEPGQISHLYGNYPGHKAPSRSVVLIDEIDKAPRDFPNDLLNEVEGMYFKIPELGNEKVSAAENMRPIVVITSNSEKNISEAFLRRCVFYDLPFPKRKALKRIVHSRLGQDICDNTDLLHRALDLFDLLRDTVSGLQKKPSTSELLGWLQILQVRSEDAPEFIISETMIEPTLSTLIKTADDREKARELIKQWLNKEGR